MKQLISILLSVISINITGQIRIEKIGVSAGIHRVTSSYSHYKGENWGKKYRTLVNQRIGGKILFPLLGRFSLESGLFLDKLYFKNKDDNPSSYIIDSDNILSIDQHTMIKLGVPLTLLCRTYQTEACVTFLKLT